MSGYIGPIPVPQGIQNKETFTATASQTTFNTNGYTDGDFINVYLNGVRLINGTDYTATNGSDIVLTQEASLNDVLDFETFNQFSLASQQFENITLKNPTHEDTDGGRESTLIFKGEQSGGEISTLAEIEASHDGTSDDEKGDLIFRTNDGSDGSSPTEAMRIQSDQTILAGSPTTDDDQTFQIIKTSASSTLGIHSNRAAVGGSALILTHNRNTSVGSFTALNDDDQLGRITFQGCDGTDIKTEGAQIHAEINGTVGSNDLPTDLVFSTTADGASVITERMRIDNGGNALVGKSATGIATVGAELKATGEVVATVSGDACAFLNRTTSDGTIVDFRKANSNVGKIVILNGDPDICIGTIDTGFAFLDHVDAITPHSPNSNAGMDNHTDLGFGSRRWQDIFATNSTINTSDENEKQQIASLTSAEITAAKAISKLFKNYKWNSAVAAKGDNARIHTGVIAQQVRTAMSDAGLDVTKYAFWCSNTWWTKDIEVAAVEADEENGIEAADAYTYTKEYYSEDDAPDDATEHTRLAIRYPELLAFIGAATEQRLTSIEARLDALEAG